MRSSQDEVGEGVVGGMEEGFWHAKIDISRTPSPAAPSKRRKITFDDIRQNIANAAAAAAATVGGVGTKDTDFNELFRADLTPESLGSQHHIPPHDVPTSLSSTAAAFTSEALTAGHLKARRKKMMQTGCIPCLVKGIPCDPKNPECRMAISDDWNLNYGQYQPVEDASDQLISESMSLTVFRPDVKWRRNWRERHSLNFFVNFSAPQMAGFFDSTFWQRMVIQTSYHEPAILHAITAIGALHECIMQRAFADEKRKARAIEFALSQCNQAISCLTTRQAAENGLDFIRRGQRVPNSRLALTTCVLFTCFEAMQGRCDSAVNHALQGRRLLQATGRPDVTSMTPAEEDDLEQMRPIVERLEVQATALLDKGRRPEVDTSDQTPPLPPIEFVFSLDHAHNTLHTALNSVMRFMQGFHPTAPRDHIAVTMAEKFLRYSPWFAKWEAAFTTYLADRREQMSNMDLKRAMVLKANHLVGTMLASVDQSAGPVAYDAYESEFRAIVDLAREVLASFSCPPLPTLTGGSSGTPYLSFSLWVTDPLWMAISRCRNPSIRQAAFTLLSQNPRQEGIWHAGPQLTNHKYVRKADNEASSGNKRKLPPSSRSNGTAGAQNGTQHRQQNGSEGAAAAAGTSNVQEPVSGIVTEVHDDPAVAQNGSGENAKGEWADLRDRIEVNRPKYSTNGDGGGGGETLYENDPNDDGIRTFHDGRAWQFTSKASTEDVQRYSSHCTGRCSIPSLEEVRDAAADVV